MRPDRLLIATLKMRSKETCLTLWKGRPVISIKVGDGLIACYGAAERYVTVEQGRATLVGLRGLGAVRTIDEANAANHIETEVLRAIYSAKAGWERAGDPS
ncbi:CRISPR-associated helicase Cas3 [Novosphingobium sp. 9U]|nr:CRISPR-associated helicase Cas3 [Novosphingobium sp. 9U]